MQAHDSSILTSRRHRVVIVGAGFGGLFAAKALRGADADVTVIDRTNHNLLKPLLYQLATGILAEGDIAPPHPGHLAPPAQRKRDIAMGGPWRRPPGSTRSPAWGACACRASWPGCSGSPSPLVALTGLKNRITALFNWTIAFVGRGRPQRAITTQQVFARQVGEAQAAAVNRGAAAFRSSSRS